MVTEFKKLWENPNPKMYTLIFEYNSIKFKIHIEHTNGTPCGFNYKCALAIMTPDGTFSNILDDITTGFNWHNCYTDDSNSSKITVFNDTAIKAFKNFVKKVYC